MKPVRILQVLASLDRGGAETMLMNLYRDADRSELQFDFVVNENSREYAYEKEIEDLGGVVYRIPRYKIYNHFSYKRAWKRLLSEHPEWRIVHGHHTSPAFIYFRAAKSMGRVTIAHSHMSGGEDSLKSKMKIFMRNLLLSSTDYKMACSDEAAKWMFGECGDGIYRLNNAIDAKRFIFDADKRERIRRELSLSDKFVIGHVGRFIAIKNQAFLIDILRELRYRNKNAVLMLVGDGALRGAAEKKAAELGLSDNVVFTGMREDVPDLLQAMDMFAFPSLFEGLGLAVIEAQASGLPCLISDTVPAEACLTDLVEMASLSESADSWANRILKYTVGYERRNTFAEIKERGYDIGSNSKWLQGFYLDKIWEKTP